MACKPVKTTFRVPWSEVIGRNPARTHKGDFDTEIAKNVGTRDWPSWVQYLWATPEAKAFRAKRSRALAYYSKKSANDAIIEELRVENTALKKQLESCKAQTGDASKWATLKALVRELVGLN